MSQSELMHLLSALIDYLSRFEVKQSQLLYTDDESDDISTKIV